MYFGTSYCIHHSINLAEERCDVKKMCHPHTGYRGTPHNAKGIHEQGFRISTKNYIDMIFAQKINKSVLVAVAGRLAMYRLVFFEIPGPAMYRLVFFEKPGPCRVPTFFFLKPGVFLKPVGFFETTPPRSSLRRRSVQKNRLRPQLRRANTATPP